ncbi:MAG TPA: amino acid adenylation domain-containing protein [Acidobacteriota bacterium]|nr:amino acid adenylation domain-containing protein [Acidobacteriota bacterium]
MMKPTKEELFRQELERQGLVLARTDRIEKRPGPREGEASFAQRRLWLNQMLDQESTVYNVLLALKIEGRLAFPAAAQALQVIVDRHEALRTCFRVVEGKPHQIVRPWLAAQLGCVDLTGLADPSRLLDEIVSRKQRTAFRLDSGPLFDFTLVRVVPGVTVVLIALHHIIFDFLSSQVLFDEFNRLYGDFLQGLPCDLPELRVHYLDYSHWQQQNFEAERSAAALQYWKRWLGSGEEMAVTEVPGDRNGLSQARFQPAYCPFEIPSEVAREVNRVSRQAGVSAFCVWLAGFHLLLQRYTDADDVLVCVPHSERNDPDLENAIGFFINFVVVKLRVLRHLSFQETLKVLNDTYLEAIGDKAYPFDKLVEALSPARQQGMTRLGEVGFGYQRTTRSDWQLGGLKVSFLDVNVPIAKSEFSLSIFEGPQECRGYIEYNAARYSGAMIEGMTRHYCDLLSRLLKAPQQPLGAVLQASLERPSPRRQAAQAADGRCLSGLFERQAERVPDRTALIVDGVHLSYRSVNRRANQIARHLRRNGVGLQSAVGLLLPRGVDAYLGLLAVLKCGAVYVPMDPKHPAAYLAKMAETADVSHILAPAGEAASWGQALAGLPLEILDAESVRRQAGSEPAGNLDLPLSPRMTAYVCFTSGSSGESKGVAVAHGAAARHMGCFVDALSFSEGDRVLQFSALTFDVSLEQVFSAWSVGAALLPRGDQVWGVREFVDFLQQEQVTVANPPTTYWNQVVKVGAASGLRIEGGALRCMIAGGEAMLAASARLWWQMSAQEVRLVNAYGPTEAIITATLQEVSDPQGLEAGSSAPIGRSLQGRRAYVADRQGLPLPPGASGELYLAGPMLAQGYLKSPRLTALHFQPASPSGQEETPGGRAYRSGDRVRLRPDGAFEFLQRQDDEVKIRGVRVTPGLIESVLLENSKIVEGAVVVRQGNGFQPAGNGGPSGDDQAAWMALVQGLPEAFLGQALDEIEALERQSPPASPAPGPEDGQVETPVISKRFPHFELSLRLTSEDFLKTPRGSQRNWVIDRTLEECAQDLRQLDSLTRRFVAGGERIEIQGDLSDSEARLNDSELVIEGQQIMQDWQKPLMRELAAAVAEHHGDVLEIGFGMGLSAGYIQEQGVRRHIIIEANRKVADAARIWRRRYPDRQIQIVQAKWQDVIEELDPVDGVLFDTYPMTEEEFRRHVISDVTFAQHFFPFAAGCLRAGGVFTYYSNEIDSLSRRHQRALFQYFSSLRVNVVEGLEPPADSQNWWADSMAVVRAYK